MNRRIQSWALGLVVILLTACAPHPQEPPGQATAGGSGLANLPAKVNSVGISSGNSSNSLRVDGRWQGGLLTAQGEWVYFSAVNEDLSLYKMQQGGGELQKLGDARGSFLNVIGDWLYFSNRADAGRLYKLRTDGSQLTKVADDACEYVSVAGEWIYYGNNSDQLRLYKVRTDGSGRTRLSESAAMLPYVSGEWVYYLSKQEGSFWRMQTDGSEQQLVSKQLVRAWCIADDWLYYLTDKNGMCIQRMRLDGSDPADVQAYQADNSTINLVGRRMAVALADKILIISLETLETEREIDAQTEVICTVGDDWVYYVDNGRGGVWCRFNLETGASEQLR